jgi:hypothetical protein
MNFFIKCGKLSENKNWSIQFNKWSFNWNDIFGLSLALPDNKTTWFSFYFSLFGSLLNFSISWDKKYDHAGFDFFFTLFSYQLTFEIHDVRHWNDKEDRWETEEDYENT